MDAGLDVYYCIVTDGDARWFRPRCAPLGDRQHPAGAAQGGATLGGADV
jgi:hypothetical protein